MTSKTSGAGGGTLLEDLSLDLTNIAAMLAHLAETDARRQAATAAAVPVTAHRVAAVIAARRARADALGLDTAGPSWSLLLELFHAGLEQRPVKLSHLAAAAGVPATTTSRWLDLFSAAGLAERRPDPTHVSAVIVALTGKGEKTMLDLFGGASM